MKRLEAHFGADAEHATPKQLRRRKDASELYATQSETEKNQPNRVERVTKLLVACFGASVESATPRQLRRREAFANEQHAGGGPAVAMDVVMGKAGDEQATLAKKSAAGRSNNGALSEDDVVLDEREMEKIVAHSVCGAN